MNRGHGTDREGEGAERVRHPDTIHAARSYKETAQDEPRITKMFTY